MTREYIFQIFKKNFSTFSWTFNRWSLTKKSKIETATRSFKWHDHHLYVELGNLCLCFILKHTKKIMCVSWISTLNLCSFSSGTHHCKILKLVLQSFSFSKEVYKTCVFVFFIIWVFNRVKFMKLMNIWA